jgi:ABC-type phosphate/phosphonate transport system substrate-binding protein
MTLKARDIARSGFITALDKPQTGNSRHEDQEDLLAILPASSTTAGSGKPLQAITRRQITTFFKQTVVGDHYSCLQNVVRKQFLGQRGG